MGKFPPFCCAGKMPARQPARRRRYDAGEGARATRTPGRDAGATGNRPPATSALKLLLVAQGDDGIHAGGTAGGQAAGQERNQREQEHGETEYQRISGLYSIEQRGH